MTFSCLGCSALRRLLDHGTRTERYPRSLPLSGAMLLYFFPFFLGFDSTINPYRPYHRACQEIPTSILARVMRELKQWVVGGIVRTRMSNSKFYIHLRTTASATHLFFRRGKKEEKRGLGHDHA